MHLRGPMCDDVGRWALPPNSDADESPLMYVISTHSRHTSHSADEVR